MKKFIVLSNLLKSLILLLPLASPSIAQTLKEEIGSKSFHINIPILPHRRGFYLIPLSFGTPAQTLHFVFDTGSGLVWSPCGPKFNFHTADLPLPFFNLKSISTFNQTNSSSSRMVLCNDPKCWWIAGQPSFTHCLNCESDPDDPTQICTQPCPTYEYFYKHGSTSGVLLLETLHFSDETVHEFLFGCSTYSHNLPFGVAGFNRRPESLLSQMDIKKFSYCFPDNQFLKLQGISTTGSHSKDLSHIPFLKVPRSDYSMSLINNHYNVTLENIIIGQNPIHIHNKNPRNDGNGGTKIEVGVKYTYLEQSIFNAFVEEFEKQVGQDMKAGNSSSCYNIFGKHKHLPPLIFKSKDVKMELPWWDYLVPGKHKEVLCLTITPMIRDHIRTIPDVILGNHHQQNFYMEYDMKEHKLGFRRQKCESEGFLTIQR